MTGDRVGLPVGLGLWAGFLDRLPAAEAITAVRRLEQVGVETIWLQEYSGVDPFVRAALYLGATERLRVSLGVATIHGRDPESMVAVSSTLEDAFPCRFALGLGVSHAHLASNRGAEYRRPLSALRDYVAAMEAAVGRRQMPALFIGALGPRMVEFGGGSTGGVHTYFCPVEHTAAARASLGVDAWLGPTQMVAVGADGSGWRDGVRNYLGLCLGMPNYRRNLTRFGFDEADLDAPDDRLVDALVVADEPAVLGDRVAAHRAAGANHLVLQFVPPPPADVVLGRVSTGLLPDVA